MGEELIQKGYQKHGTFISDFEYYNIGSSTLNQLKRKKIIPDKDYGAYSSRKPDGLLVDRRNKKQINVLVTLEYKKPSEFRTDKQKREATQQCNDVCQEIGSKIGVITDGQTTIWINPSQKNTENDYVDDKKKKRSYSIIRNEDKKDLTEPFNIQKKSEKDVEKLDDDTKNTLFYIERILSCVTSSNSTLKATEEVDPLGLAKSVWQDIYINTGKDPTKCLYNVVELFIFKFLSDLKVLRTPYDVQNLLKMYEQGNSNREVLRHYANVSRKEIVRLFPKGEDGTNIINGTIFVDSSGNPVESQANLFKNSLTKYDNFGTLKNIKKEFKTKLFEIFLKQSQDKSRLGQFLTPRKVVRPMTEMASVEDLPNGSRICDPFCGVGGFLLEPLHKTKLRHRFEPKNGKINPKITMHGFDKGNDGDEERTVILAKANMLIYMSDIVEKHPTLTWEFSKIFNETFHLLKESNLGTLKKVITREEDKYDLILTNPPYITSGVSSIRDEIKAEGIEDYFTTGGKGVEGLALEWIIRNLRKSGKAFVVIPDSILNVAQNKRLREYLLKECFLNCIISLPIKTFFNTPKKTYIIGFTKKQRQNEQQDYPVFTYLVSNIGETLDVNRFEVEGKSDIEKAKELFNQYKGSPASFLTDDKRCKLQPINKFKPKEFWTIDRWWTKEEKIELGIEEEEKVVDIDEFKDKLTAFSTKLIEYKKMLDKV